jgi:hypothetical protein
MRKRLLVVLGPLLIMLAGATQAVACYCGKPVLNKVLEKSESVFVGQVVEISGPRGIEIGANAQNLYVIKFFVWERWKGARDREVQILAEQGEKSCFAYPPMRVGETYLVFAQPVTVNNASVQVQGMVDNCTRTSRLGGASPRPEVDKETGLLDLFALDRLTKQGTPQGALLFGRESPGQISRP